jgi:hypothetical protein
MSGCWCAERAKWGCSGQSERMCFAEGNRCGIRIRIRCSDGGGSRSRSSGRGISDNLADGMRQRWQQSGGTSVRRGMRMRMRMRTRMRMRRERMGIQFHYGAAIADSDSDADAVAIAIASATARMAVIGGGEHERVAARNPATSHWRGTLRCGCACEGCCHCCHS